MQQKKFFSDRRTSTRARLERVHAVASSPMGDLALMLARAAPPPLRRSTLTYWIEQLRAAADDLEYILREGEQR